MAAEAGLKPWEIDAISPNEVWISIEGYGERNKKEWERTRALAYYVARFGNSKPKGFPKTFEEFWPLSGDDQKEGVRKATPGEIFAMWQKQKKKDG